MRGNGELERSFSLHRTYGLSIQSGGRGKMEWIMWGIVSDWKERTSPTMQRILTDTRNVRSSSSTSDLQSYYRPTYLPNLGAGRPPIPNTLTTHAHLELALVGGDILLSHLHSTVNFYARRLVLIPHSGLFHLPTATYSPNSNTYGPSI